MADDASGGPRFIDPMPWDLPGMAPHWDQIDIGGTVVPGLASVEVERENKWDTKKSKGSHGGKRNFSGADLAKVKITIRIFSSDAYAVFVRDHLAKWEPNPGKKTPDVFTITHGVTADRNVASITFDKIAGPKISNGIMEFDVTATEFREPEKKNATGTAKGGPPLSATKNANGSLSYNCTDLWKAYQGNEAQLAQFRAQEEQISKTQANLSQANSPHTNAAFDDLVQKKADNVRVQDSLVGVRNELLTRMRNNQCESPPSTSSGLSVPTQGASGSLSGINVTDINVTGGHGI